VTLVDEQVEVVQTPASVVVVRDPENIVVVEELVEIVEVAAVGNQGGKGDKGDQGDQGDTGPQGDQGNPGVPGGGFNYVHDQAIASLTWHIVHNLNGFPNVTSVDSSDREIEGAVTYLSAFALDIDFGVVVGGTAYLS
jgi:hypothetical protein